MTTAMNERELDIVVYGATGYSGTMTCEHLVDYCKVADENKTVPDLRTLKWGIAGRSQAKLDALNAALVKRAGPSGAGAPSMVVQADGSDPVGMSKMAAKTKVLLNCAGPFAVSGKGVIDACLAAGTHYTDINGEPGYMKSVLWPTHELAQKKGVYIVPCTGFDSIPAELGVHRLLEKRTKQQAAAGRDVTPCVVDAYVHYEGGVSDGTFYTLVGSIVGSLGGGGKKKAKKGDGEAAPSGGENAPLVSTEAMARMPRVKQRGPHKSRLLGMWCLPFPTADPQLIQRTYALDLTLPPSPWRKQRLFSQCAGYRHWLSRKSFFQLLKVLVGGLFLFLLLKLGKVGQKVITMYRGSHSGAGPSEKELETVSAGISFYATPAPPKGRSGTGVNHDPATVTSITFKGTHVYKFTAQAAVWTAACLVKHVSCPSINACGPPSPQTSGGAWTVTSIFAELPSQVTNRTDGTNFTLLDDLQYCLTETGAMTIE